MSITGAFSRSVLRSTSFRKAAAATTRVTTTSEAKAKAKTTKTSSSSSSPFRLSSSNNQKPLSHGHHRIIFKSPVELSSCVDSLMPFHSANSSAILISKLGVSLRAYTWLLQACIDDL